MYSILYMRVADEDLTTQARIRRAAIKLFGRHGFDVGLRAIADEADVSLGLIRHHYGSKEKLREACDAYVLDEIAHAQQEQTSDPTTAMFNNMSNIDAYAPLVFYLLQAIRAGGALAHAVMDRMIADAEKYMEQGVENGIIKPSRDPAKRTRFLAMSKMGALLMEFSMAPADEDLAVTWQRYTEQNALPGLEMYTEGLLTDRRMLNEYLDYVTDPPETEPPAEAS